MWNHFRVNGLGYLFAILTTAVATILSTWIGSSSVVLLQIMAVLIGSWSGGIYPGLLATILCVLTNSYFFFHPVGSFTVEDTEANLSLVLFFMVGVAIAVVNELKKRAFGREDRRRDELQILMSSIGDGVIATDLEGRVTSVNLVAESLTGWTQAEALGKPLMSVFYTVNELSRAMISNPAMKAIRTRTTCGLTSHTILIAKDLIETPIEINAAPMRAGSGQITGAVLVFRDITERRKADQQQRENEERFRALIKATAEVVWTTNAFGMVVEDSPTWREFTGQSLDDWLKNAWWPAIHPEDRERAQAAWRTAIEEKKIYLIDYRVQSAEGGYRWTSVRAVPVCHENGSIREWIGMNVDVTRERSTVKNLQESERRYQLVAEAANDAIWDWDLITDEVTWNIGLRRLFQYSGSQVGSTKRWWSEQVHPDDRERVLSAIHEVIDSGSERWSGEYRFLKADGTYAFVYDRGRIVRDHGTPVRMVGSMLDLTERKRVEQVMAERSRLADLRASVSSVLSAVKPSQQVLQECCETILKQIHSCSAGIWLLNENQQVLELQAQAGLQKSGEAAIPVGQFKIGQIAATGEAFITQTLPLDIPICDNERIQEAQMVGFAGYPLVVENHTVGVLGIFAKEELPQVTLKDLASLANTIAQYIQRKKGEEKLREQELLYRSIFESSNDAIMIFDVEGQLVEANPFACQMHGYTYQEMIGLSGMELIEAKDKQKFQRYLTRVQAGKSFSDQGTHLRKDGTQLFVEVQGAELLVDGRPHLLAVVRDVTERRRSEQQLIRLTQESERQRRLYDTILSNSIDLIYVFDLQHRFTYANQALLNMWGKTWEESIGKNCLELGYPQWHAERHSAEIEQVVATKLPIRGEVPFTGTAGRRIYDYIFYPVLGINGEVEAVAGSTRDVTERKLIENNLRQSESRFRQLADAMPQIVWTATPNGYIDYYNSRWYEFTGLEQEQRGNSNWEPVIHPHDINSWKEIWTEAVETGTAFEIEYRLFDRVTKTFLWFLGRAIPITDEHGDVARWIGTCTDINRQKRNEEISDFLADASSQLVELVSDESIIEEFAQIAVPSFADWCTVDMLEKGGHCRRLALVHTDSTQVKLAEQLNRLYPPSLDENQILWKVLRTGASQLLERIHDNNRIAEAQDDEHLRRLREVGIRSCICVPLVSRGEMLGAITFAMAESGRHMSKVDLQAAEDVAHRFIVALENTHLYQQLREADRRKDEFLAMLAHELRNPLAPIRSGLDLLTLQPHEEQEVLQLMKEQVEHLVRLVDDLLDVSRIMRGKIDLRVQVVSLKDILKRAIESAHWSFEEKKQEFTSHIPNENIFIKADPVRMVQVINNLLNNASKYSNEQGKIHLEVSLHDDMVEIQVSDNGIGIEPELLPQVFDLFTQSSRALDRAQGGLGIGLTLVQNLVEMHNGSVSVHSEGPDQGSKFTVLLPITEALSAPEIKPQGINHRQGHQILVVDDNQGAAKLLAMLLEKMGPHHIELVHDGPAALEKVQSYHPDLILLDIGLPGMDGYEVGRNIRKNPDFDQTLLVALTGYGREEDRQLSKAAGFDEHLVKPPALDMLKKLFDHPKLNPETSPTQP